MSWRDPSYGSESDSTDNSDTGVSCHRETSQATEALALHAALPVRYIRDLPAGDTPAVLNCGHSVEASIRSRLMQGTSVRCVTCYLEKMRSARRMLEEF